MILKLSLFKIQNLLYSVLTTICKGGEYHEQIIYLS